LRPSVRQPAARERLTVLVAVQGKGPLCRRRRARLQSGEEPCLRIRMRRRARASMEGCRVGELTEEDGAAEPKRVRPDAGRGRAANPRRCWLSVHACVSRRRTADIVLAPPDVEGEWRPVAQRRIRELLERGTEASGGTKRTSCRFLPRVWMQR